jgi:hypothetical protein
MNNDKVIETFLLSSNIAQFHFAVMGPLPTAARQISSSYGQI